MPKQKSSVSWMGRPRKSLINDPIHPPNEETPNNLEEKIRPWVASLLPDLLQQAVTRLPDSQKEASSAAVNQQPTLQPQTTFCQTTQEHRTTLHRQYLTGMDVEGFLPLQVHSRPMPTMTLRGHPQSFDMSRQSWVRNWRTLILQMKSRIPPHTLYHKRRSTQVAAQEFVDFGSIFRQHQLTPYGMGELEPLPSGAAKPDVTVKDWAQIFMAFWAEHARWHPKEATGYGDLILKMECHGMQWAKDDIIYRQKREKKIVC